MKNLGGANANYVSLDNVNGVWLYNPTQFNPVLGTYQDIVSEFCSFKP